MFPEWPFIIQHNCMKKSYDIADHQLALLKLYFRNSETG